MKLSTFTAASSSDAVRIVQNQLGPHAVIVSMRRRAGGGLASLLHRGKPIEVVAGVPDEAGPQQTNVTAVTKTRTSSQPGNRWRSVAWLESMGMLAACCEKLEERIVASHGAEAPESLEEEWAIVQPALAGFWQAAPVVADDAERPHVFIGPPGSGKTTVLSKWLATAVLREGKSASVWRLDADTANTAEFLSLHSEMLGVRCERMWSEPDGMADLLFVDLPGVEPQNPKALAVLQDILLPLNQPHIHLVLNAAYELPVLFEQFNAFAPLMPEDLTFTHLDEERRRVKLWNFVLGTNCPLGWLSGGQKIPGNLTRAEASLLFPQETPS